MKSVELAYGQENLVVNLPDDATVLLPREIEAVPDEAEALRNALRQPVGRAPLSEIVGPDDSVVVVFSDITRPMPNDRVLPVLLAELDHVPRERIVLLNGLGTHRPNTHDELVSMMGPQIVDNYAIAQHDAWDEDDLVSLGDTRYGHPALISRRLHEASVRILTGFVEPHMFAGFSGGPKAILPGVAGFSSIMDNHSYEMLADPSATWGRTDGNPVWEEMREVAVMCLAAKGSGPSDGRRGPPRHDFMLNVTLNRQRRITGVYAGDLWEAHTRAVAFARQVAMVAVDAPYDIILTTNSGYPLDINLYQAVKGMSCAAQIIKPGGSIVIAAECRNGVPEYGEYRALVRQAGSVEGIVEMLGQPGFRHHDQWEAQIQARIQQVADVHVYSDYLSDDETRGMLFEPCHDIEETLSRLLAKHGPQARVCVLPEGPQTIPYLASV